VGQHRDTSFVTCVAPCEAVRRHRADDDVVIDLQRGQVWDQTAPVTANTMTA
jgi:hypothetical protein